MVEFTTVGIGVFSEVFADLDDWMGDFWAALDSYERGLEDARVLTARLFGLVKSFESVARLRPWRGLYRHIGEILDALVGVWNASMDAYEAASLLDAQAFQRVMQGHIDAAVSALEAWSAAKDRILMTAGVSPEDQLVIGAALSMMPDGDGGASAQQLIREVGLGTGLPPGIGEYVAVCVETATMLGERESFADLLRTTITALKTDAQTCREMVESELFRENFARALGEMYRSSTTMHLLAVISGNERLAVDAMMTAAHGIVESGTRHPVALLAALIAGMGYRAALREGASKCVRWVRSSSFGSLVADLDLDLRNAEAHRAYRITPDDGVDVLNDGGALKKHVSGMELVDAVIAGNVLAMALTMGVVLFACDSGVDVMPMLEPSESLPLIQTLQLTALLVGWPLPEVSLSSDRTEVHFEGVPLIEITPDMSEAQPLINAVTLATRVPEYVQRLVFHDGTDSPLVLEVQHTRALTGVEDSFAQSLAYVRFFHTLRRGEERAISPSRWQELILGLTRTAVAEGGVMALRKLAALRCVVRDCGDSVSAGALAKLIGDLRVEVSGGSVHDPARVLSDVSTTSFKPIGRQ
ncbi:hypothetical protein DMH04_17605 [Kibdelosporangium aridum]|uniref:Uncharacterized protein n=1 Tax=Kibdelosporangium aridum TaxID=2030 RepID=A0A428ZAN8_KIBAR|nr:hypothetical protein [Kibdelosporangium aridum]RSM85125.1 hypothetical protein DMH04_17605 [Kibdelosporangium aridum]